jgi:hypothetical protein
MFTKSRLALTAFFVAVLTLIPLSASASVPRIEATPSSSSLAPGQSVSVNFVLAEPIICASGTCDVTLDFAGAQTLGLTASPTSVTWPAAQWQQVRTITFTLDANTPATYPQAVVLRAVAQSNSEYYRAFAVDVTINLVVPDIRPVAVPEQLAVTGGNNSQGIALALIPMTAGLGLCAAGVYLRRQRRR